MEQHRDWLVGLCSRLIAIPSENRPPHGLERDVQHLFRQELEALGFQVDLYELDEVEGLREHPAYWPGRDYTDRPNLWAHKPGSGGGRSLLFSGHADVVIGSHAGQYPPYQPTITGNRLYGRGSNDMKGGMAAALLAFYYLQQHDVQLKGDLAFESVVDEEMGGANGTLAGRLRGHHADAAIIPEPTNLRVCTSHLGGVTWRITVHGKGGMGFGGEELCNPIYGIARIVTEIERYHTELGDAPAGTPGPVPGTKPNVVLSLIRAGHFDPGASDGIPESCMLELWLECYPGQTLEELEATFAARIRALCAEPGMRPYRVEWEQVTRFIPGTVADTGLAGVLAGALSEEGHPPLQAEMSPFACDAFMFNEYSPTPAVICGPVGENAHASDEFVDVDSLLKLARAYIETILQWCGETKPANG
ncbi:M20 family metallopeptidase [Paenibacillus sp. HJGM_3]